MNRPITNSALLHGLYVITQTPNHLPIASAALRGGARLIQLRDHETPAEKRLQIASELRRLTRDFGALFFVCDDVELAEQVSADGVHLEWSSLSLSDARQRLGEGALLSTGANSIERALAAQNAGADYVGVGPIFPTQTKLDAGPAIGFDGLRAIFEAISIPIAAIGGLNASNIAHIPTPMASVVSALADLPNEEQMEVMTRRLIEELASRL
ncbi:thiamine phosphate synthase [bacterium]|nr:MAG: thiamine phosphate synthase [bacterium]